MRIPLLWLFLLAGSVILLADTQQQIGQAGPGASADENEILRLEKVIVDAWLKHDTAAISPIVADDFESWSFKGMRRGKADLLRAVEKNGETSTEVNDPRVRVFGDTAIYTALITDSGKNAKGESFRATTSVTVIYLRRAGKWQMVQDHESLLQK